MAACTIHNTQVHSHPNSNAIIYNYASCSFSCTKLRSNPLGRIVYRISSSDCYIPCMQQIESDQEFITIRVCNCHIWYQLPLAISAVYDVDNQL